MYNGGKIIVGLVVFIALFAFPFYYNIGKAMEKPEPKTDTPAILQWEKEHGKKECVESKEFMRSEHMQLLNDWRDSVVRNGDRIYTNAAGKQFTMSLQNTCMNCHSNKKEFCDKCHNYMAVKPYCWGCHIQPKENKS
ncbi:MAG: sulfate reduction electron transfer complex DsrMKJOP subunit DsrJ [Nitrospirae bacterium]|nr:sulfate reduction electron transfer complex DsrMKJOP subunit DsrJ [Nitrospirota bacterium]